MDFEDKVFKTYDELVDILKNKRKLEVSDEEFLRSVLESEGYYNVINGYKAPFIKKGPQAEEFIEGTKIDDILYLYHFDRELRKIFLQYLLPLETRVKNQIAYRFSEQYGHRDYLKENNFDVAITIKIPRIKELIDIINGCINYRCDDPCIAHYQSNYKYIPLWVLNCILSFGTISKFYSLMQPQDRSAISKKYGLHEKQFTNILFVLSKARNTCAHGNRLFCFHNKDSLISFDLHHKLGIPKIKVGNIDEFSFGKNDLFSVLIAMKKLLYDNEFEDLCNDLQRSIDVYLSNISPIPSSSILYLMGFRGNWSDISIK